MTRRHISLILGSLGAASAGAQTRKPGTTIHQEIDFSVKPERIYEVLLDARKFSACTESTAEIQPQPGGAFKLFGGQIEGRNIELGDESEDRAGVASRCVASGRLFDREI